MNWQSIKTSISTGLSNIKTGISNAVSKIHIPKINLSGIKSTMGNLKNSIANKMKNLGTSIATKVKTATDKVKNVAVSAVNKIKQKYNNWDEVRRLKALDKSLEKMDTHVKNVTPEKKDLTLHPAVEKVDTVPSIFEGTKQEIVLKPDTPVLDIDAGLIKPVQDMPSMTVKPEVVTADCMAEQTHITPAEPETPKTSASEIIQNIAKGVSMTAGIVSTIGTTVVAMKDPENIQAIDAMNALKTVGTVASSVGEGNYVEAANLGAQGASENMKQHIEAEMQIEVARNQRRELEEQNAELDRQLAEIQARSEAEETPTPAMNCERKVNKGHLGKEYLTVTDMSENVQKIEDYVAETAFAEIQYINKDYFENAVKNFSIQTCGEDLEVEGTYDDFWNVAVDKDKVLYYEDIIHNPVLKKQLKEMIAMMYGQANKALARRRGDVLGFNMSGVQKAIDHYFFANDVMYQPTCVIFGQYIGLYANKVKVNIEYATRAVIMSHHIWQPPAVPSVKTEVVHANLKGGVTNASVSNHKFKDGRDLLEVAPLVTGYSDSSAEDLTRMQSGYDMI